MITIQTAIEHLVQKQDLTAEEMQTIMWSILSESVTPAQLSGFLVAMRMKGETVAELVAAVQVLKQVVVSVEINDDSIIDISGTGGDQSHTFNISTSSAFVVAAAGGKVAKHGNRSISSRSGSADVLEAAGINLTLTPQEIKECIKQVGVGFMYAPRHHTAWRHATNARKELGINTFFNIVGPLINPVKIKRQLIGVFTKNWVLPVAQLLQRLGSQHALIVHSEDGLDEISISAPTHVAELKNNQINTYVITPEQFGLACASLDSLKVNNAQESLMLVEQVLQNTADTAARDIIAMNAGAAIYIAGLSNDLTAGINKAVAILNSRAAYEKLLALKELTQSFSSYAQ